MTEYTSVRLADPADEASVLHLCHLLHEENGLFGMNDESVVAMIRKATARDGAILGVIGDTDDLRACILMYVETMWYSGQKMLQELFNFVHPDHRRTNYAKSTIHFAKYCSDKLELPLMIGIISNTRTEAKARLYGQQLQQAGVFFIHNAHLARGGESALVMS